MSGSAWPSSPLDAAEHAFKLMVSPPTQVGFDGRGYRGLPQRILPLNELRTVLLAPPTAATLRDQVWRELVCRARRDGPAWVLAAVGMAMPGLRRIAGTLTAGWRGDRDDIDAELLAGFLARLKTVDVDGPRVCGRLIDAGVRAARRARDAESDIRLLRVAVAGPIAPIVPFDHPDLVLARAVAAGVIDADEAHLIGATRLGDATLAEAAADLCTTPSRAGRWRRQAEQRLATAIYNGDLSGVGLRARSARTAQPDLTTSLMEGAVRGSRPVERAMRGARRSHPGGVRQDIGSCHNGGIARR